MKNLSIIILTWNNLDATRRCLRSIRPVMERDDVEVIVIDNASTDGTVPTIRNLYPGIQIIANHRNRGISAARNQGFMKACGQYLLLLDNDTVASPEAIEGLENYMQSHPGVGLCACRLTDEKGNTQPSLKPFPGLKIKLYSLLGFKLPQSQFVTDEEGCIEPFYVIGACQMIRREAIGQTGMLDEGIFYGPEDADFCIRLRRAGWLVKYLPQYSIIHTYQRFTNNHPFSKLAREHVKGLFHLYFKHRRIK